MPLWSASPQASRWVRTPMHDKCWLRGAAAGLWGWWVQRCSNKQGQQEQLHAQDRGCRGNNGLLQAWPVPVGFLAPWHSHCL